MLFKIPDSIWLQYYGEDWLEDDEGNLEKPNYDMLPEIGDVTWQDKRIFNSDIEYIRADIANQRIEKLESENKTLRLIAGSHSMSELRRLQEQTGWRKHGEPPEPGSYKNARGVLNWKPGDETAVDAIRRLRGNDPPEQNERSK